MPVLVMREPEGSVLGETSRLIVKRQIEYGSERNLPWGVSESAFNARDREFTYQYSSFGVPRLGLAARLGRRGGGRALCHGAGGHDRSQGRVREFRTLAETRRARRFGWYDALDFTPARLPEGVPVVPVQAYMAHHQGMILVSIANVLKDGMFRTCFHSNAMIQATELLLQEKNPARFGFVAAGHRRGCNRRRNCANWRPPRRRRFTSPHHVAPRTHLLSNGNYSVMVTAAGSGYSRWHDIAVTRWREDPTCDPWGSYVFLRDVANGRGMVGRLSAGGTRAGQLRGGVFRGSRRNHPPGRLHPDLHRDTRVARGRRGGAQRIDHQRGQPRP